MKVELTIDGNISVDMLIKAQKDSERLGGGFDVTFNSDNTINVSWDIVPNNTIEFIQLLDDLQEKHSLDVMDNCVLVNTDDIAFHQSLSMCSIGECIHTPNSLV